jgi:hypothetical protein
MTAGGVPIGPLVFTVVVTVAILAVVLDTFAEAVMAATLALAIWQLVSLFGPTLWLAIGLLTLAIVVRVTGLVLGVPAGEGLSGPAWSAFLNALGRGRDRPERRGDDR